MDKNNTHPSEVHVGMEVEVSPQSDRTRKVLVAGTITEILTKNAAHPHGILVLLDTGVKGRVRAIVSVQGSGSEFQAEVQSDEAVSPKASLKQLIADGESHTAEFKSRALWSSKYTEDDIKSHRPRSNKLHQYGQATSKVILVEALAGFLNTDGGVLIIGIEEVKTEEGDVVVGVELDYALLKDPNRDGYRRMLVDLFKDYFPPSVYNHLNDYIQIMFEEIDGLLVCGILVSKSDRRVFVTVNKTEHFWVRTDASTRELIGSDILAYCDKRFANRT